MINKQKIIWDVYGVLLDLKIKYDTTDLDIDFQEYAKLEMKGLISKAMEWLADDELEKKESENWG